jgi:hypothetical protein
MTMLADMIDRVRRFLTEPMRCANEYCTRPPEVSLAGTPMCVRCARRESQRVDVAPLYRDRSPLQ